MPSRLLILHQTTDQIYLINKCKSRILHIFTLSLSYFLVSGKKIKHKDSFKLCFDYLNYNHAEYIQNNPKREKTK